MELFAQYGVVGLATGGLFALVAFGIVLLYRTSRVLNFAHGDLATFATFICYTFLTQLRVPFGVAVVATFAAAVVIGAGFYFLFLRPAREATLFGLVIIHLAFALVLNGFANQLLGSE